MLRTQDGWCWVWGRPELISNWKPREKMSSITMTNGKLGQRVRAHGWRVWAHGGQKSSLFDTAMVLAEQQGKNGEIQRPSWKDTILKLTHSEEIRMSRCFHSRLAGGVKMCTMVRLWKVGPSYSVTFSSTTAMFWSRSRRQAYSTEYVACLRVIWLSGADSGLS